MRRRTVVFAAVLVALSGVAGVTGPVPAARAAGPRPNFQLPFPCGERWWASTRGGHPAIDFNDHAADDNGRPVVAAAAGVATIREQRPKNPRVVGWGYYVEIDHGGGWKTRYAHLQAAGRVSGYVRQGQIIGRVGSSGHASAPHLHWEQIADGVRQTTLYANGSPVATGTSYGAGDPSHVSANCPSGDPFGEFDSVASPAAATMRVRGWALDLDRPTYPVTVRVTVGGPVGAAGVERHSVGAADELRPAIGGVHPGAGERHGFDATFSTEKSGRRQVCVYAINVGPGANERLGCRTVTIAPLTVPGAPRDVSSVLGSASGVVRVSFSPPSSSGGAPIDSYVVSASPGGRTVSGSGSPIVVSGLVAGKYSITVRAVNAVGAGPASAPSTVTTTGPGPEWAFASVTVPDARATGTSATSSLAGDFDGDGRGDILWWGAGSSSDVLWRGRADGLFTAAPLTVRGSGYRPAVGDFDGDGRADVLWYRPGPGSDRLWLGQPSGPPFRSGPAVSLGGDFVPKVGDFDGDGRDDIYWLAPAGRDGLWRGRPDGRFARVPDAPQRGGGRSGFTGDFDGDGRDDLFWYEPGTRADRLWLGTGDGFGWGPSVDVDGWYRPAVGDFDGDGRADVLWYSPDWSAADYLWRGAPDGSFGGSTPRIRQGGDFRPRIADFDGDGRADIFWLSHGPATDELWHGN